MPLRVLPFVDLGVRMQLELPYPYAGFVATFDFYPGSETADPRTFEATLLFQVGL